MGVDPYVCRVVRAVEGHREERLHLNPCARVKGRVDTPCSSLDHLKGVHGNGKHRSRCQACHEAFLRLMDVFLRQI